MLHTTERQALVALPAARMRGVSKWLQLLVSFSCNTLAFSITPYYSSQAKSKFLMREAWIGLTFAAFPLAYMIGAACMSFANISHASLGKLCAWIRVLVLAYAAAAVLFGATPHLYQPTTMEAAEFPERVGMTYALLFGSFRFMQGATTAVLDVFVLVYLAKLYPESLSAVVGEKEAVMGLGVVFGPPIGGALFQVGGFTVPPLATAAFTLTLSIITYALIRFVPSLNHLHRLRSASCLAQASEATQRKDVGYSTDDSQRSDDPSARLIVDTHASCNNNSNSTVHNEGDEPPLPSFTVEHVRTIFTQFPLFVSVGPMVLSVLSIACFAFLESMVPLYANRTYDVEAWAMGLIMAGGALVYALTAVVVGQYFNVSRAGRRPNIITIAAVVLGVGMFLVAPSFSVVDGAAGGAAGTAHGVALLVSGVLITAAGLATIAVAGVSLLVDYARSHSDALVPASGAVMNFAMSLGGFLGPVVGSALADQYGFPVAFFAFSCAAVIVAAHYLLLLLVGSRRRTS